MIITPEQAAPQGPRAVRAPADFVQQAAEQAQRIDTVERDLLRQLLGLGHTLLSAFVARQGDGDLGPNAETPEGRTVRRLPEPHDRRYVSIFGELTIARVVYGTREGQKIERVPLDERLGAARGRLLLRAGGLGPAALPEGVVRRGGPVAGDAPGAAAGDPDAGAHEPGRGGVRPAVPGVARRHRPPRRKGRCWSSPPTARGCRCAARAAGRPQAPPPPRPRGRRRTRSRWPASGRSTRIEPFVRKADDILDEVLRDEKAKDRPRPQHKHVWAEMTREVEGERRSRPRTAAVLPVVRRVGGPQPRGTTAR